MLRWQMQSGVAWKQYRIWSTDWFMNSDREMTKMLAWLETLMARKAA
jgi:hypothetical protein